MAFVTMHTASIMIGYFTFAALTYLYSCWCIFRFILFVWSPFHTTKPSQDINSRENPVSFEPQRRPSKRSHYHNLVTLRSCHFPGKTFNPGLLTLLPPPTTTKVPCRHGQIFRFWVKHFWMILWFKMTQNRQLKTFHKCWDTLRILWSWVCIQKTEKSAMPARANFGIGGQTILVDFMISNDTEQTTERISSMRT